MSKYPCGRDLMCETKFQDIVKQLESLCASEYLGQGCYSLSALSQCESVLIQLIRNAKVKNELLASEATISFNLQQLCDTYDVIRKFNEIEKISLKNS